MNRALATSIAILLVATPLTFGQSPTEERPATSAKVPDDHGAPAPADLGHSPSGECTALGPRVGVFTAEAEYLLWTNVKSRQVFPVEASNVLGVPNAVVLGTLSDEQIDKHVFQGGRFTLG